MIRADKLLGHRLWMTPIASYIGFFSMLYGAYLLITGAVSLWWILPMAFFTTALLFGVTVGLHRLFCHKAFKTSDFWHVVLAYLGTIAIYGSSVQWCAMHMSHHMYSDTPKDPHYAGWRYLFWKKNNPTIFNKRTLLRLYRNPLHRWLHKYYVVPLVVTVAGLALGGGLHAVLFCYLIPMGWLHFVGSAHQVFAHGPEGALDRPWREFWLFTGGEWSHLYHHNHGSAPRFGRFDAGWHFIRAIRQ